MAHGHSLSASVPASAGAPLLDAFVSYSMEFSSFPDFAGNRSAPNTFSDALLNNLGNLTGTKPYIRVGGNTQNYALYNASLPWAINGTYNLSRSADYPTTIYIGPSFFEVPLLCKALAPDTKGNATDGSYTNHQLYTWEYGNEPDLLSTSSQGPTRPPDWNEATFVVQWLNGTRQIQNLVKEHCPELVQDTNGRTNASTLRSQPSALADYAGFMAPSFAGVKYHLKAPTAWNDGLDIDGKIALFSSHNYISGATSPAVTLQGTLMNHSNTVRSVNSHVAEYESIFGAPAANSSSPRPRHIFGEANSLYNEGKPGLSNTFGATLWGIDFLMYSASVEIGRVHMHQGTNYRYASWQPVDTDLAPRGTTPPYYGNIAVAAALGNTRDHNVSVAALSLSGASPSVSDVGPAYAVYVDGQLSRVLVLNLRGHNTTIGGTGLASSTGISLTGNILVQRLFANGSDAITGITWDGWSYNLELAGGKPVRVNSVTTGENLAVLGGQVTVSVPDSSAVLLHF